MTLIIAGVRFRRTAKKVISLFVVPPYLAPVQAKITPRMPVAAETAAQTGRRDLSPPASNPKKEAAPRYIVRVWIASEGR